MSHVHKIKHHAHHHKERIKHHAAHHKEKVKHHIHHHKERIKHRVHRHKQSLPEIIFNRSLVILFLITLAIPVTVLLASQQQNLQKEAADNQKPASRGYIVEFNEATVAQEVRVGTAGVTGREERKRNITNRHKKNKEDVINIVKKRSGAQENAESKVKAEYTNVINGVAMDITSEEAQEIEELPSVKAVYPNLEVKETLMESVPMISADKVWNLKDSTGTDITGRNVIVAVIDTGIDYRHPDLGESSGSQIFNSKVIGGRDFINNDNDPIDDKGHGTHVAGIIAGNGVLKGVAPDAKLVAYKVLDANGSGSFATVLAGIEAAIATRTDNDPANDISIINLSLGAYCGATYWEDCGPDDVLSRGVENASANGIVSIVAAGNTGSVGSGTINTPGTARSAVTVGSINKSKQISSFSSRGPVVIGSEILNKPDVVAPGEGICSAKSTSYSGINCIDSNHVSLNGTSMATPLVAGMAALVKQQTPSYNASEIKYMLVQNATSLGNDINAEGKGMIDASKIFILNPTSAPTLSPSPTPRPTFTPTPSPNIFKVTISASGDAFVRSSAPRQNFGKNTGLQVDSSPNEIAYMKFNLATLFGKNIISAKLRIKVNDATNKSLNLRRGEAGNWNEGSINYNNRPSLEATIRSFNAKTVNQVIELDIKSAVILRRGGILTLGIVSTGNEEGTFYSRESGNSSNRPQLVVEYQ